MLALPRRQLLWSFSTHSYAYTYQLTSPWTTTTSRHPPSNNSTRYRYLSSTPPLSKKKDKSKPSAAAAPEPASNSNIKSKPTSEDPEDLSSVETGIANAVNRLKDELSKLRAGGRINTEVIEGLKVNLKTGNGNGNESVRLGELAQVVPRGGRMSAVLVSEEEHIKPITSAITSSNLSLTPQPDAHNKLQLNIPIPPPTKESRDQSVNAARTAWERASNGIRDSRASMHKHLQQLEKKKIARGDDVKKAHDRMEKIVEKGQKDVKELLEGAKRALEKV